MSFSSHWNFQSNDKKPTETKTKPPKPKVEPKIKEIDEEFSNLSREDQLKNLHNYSEVGHRSDHKYDDSWDWWALK